MKSRTTRGFWKAYDALPLDVRRMAVRVYLLWRDDTAHPSVRFKCVSEKHGVFSARIGLHWRALGYRDRDADGETLTWFWVGSHADYDKMISNL